MPIKPRQALRELKRRGCVEVKNNHGSHQKIKNPANNLSTSVPVHLGKDIDDNLWKKILNDLGLN